MSDHDMVVVKADGGAYTKAGSDKGVQFMVDRYDYCGIMHLESPEEFIEVLEDAGMSVLVVDEGDGSCKPL